MSNNDEDVSWKELIAIGVLILCITVGVGSCNYLSSMNDHKTEQKP